MKTKTLSLTFFFVCLYGMNLQAGEIDSGKYVPSILPNEKSDIWEATLQGATVGIVPDDSQLGSYDGLRLDTRSSDDSTAFFSRNINAHTTDTITVTAKVRLDGYIGSYGLGGCAISVENDQNAEVLLIRPTGLYLYNKQVQYSMDTMSSYHEYIIVATGNTFRVYVDGGSTPIINTTFGGQSWAARSMVRFGDMSYGASALSSWAYVRYAVTTP
jgi:hypothetical protein